MIRVFVISCAVALSGSLYFSPTLRAQSQPSGERGSFVEIEAEYERSVLPLLDKYCLECHATDIREGELDLERFATFGAVRSDPTPWQKVFAMLKSSEMPPDDSTQLSDSEKNRLVRWLKAYLDAEALANAGDPGPVILRRLNNAEYTYSIQDLTGIALQPAREFPVDGAAGEGFTNIGNALVMSPALLEKYLAAGKGVAEHLVLLPDGLRFSIGTTPRDWANELMTRIRAIYLKSTTDNSDASLLDHWSVADPRQATLEDGRIDLAHYCSVLVRHRARLQHDLNSTQEIARTEHVNPKYLGILARMLVEGQPDSFLLESIRHRWRTAKEDEAPAMAAEVRSWQDRLWKFNSVGHFGSIRPWQEPTNPIAPSEEFRVRLPGSSVDATLNMFLAANQAGSGSEAGHVVWQNPRIERAGQSPLPLRDVRGVSAVLQRTRRETLAGTQRYLSAAFELRQSANGADLAEVARRHKVDPLWLNAWLDYLGIVTAGKTTIQEYLRQPIHELAGHSFVRGWGQDGLSALSVVGNASDQSVKIPGDLPPHTIAVHPRPERWIAVGWKSPIDGRVSIMPRVKDAHNTCGNGIRWSLEYRRGNQRRMLRSGVVELGTEAKIELADNVAVQRGDLVSLIIDSRDNDHTCDLTQIDLEIREQARDPRVWSLAGDCADSLDTANPHDDSLGNRSVWHFYTGLANESAGQAVIPAESIVSQWLEVDDSSVADDLAGKLQALLTQPLASGVAAADAVTYQQLTATGGPLFSRVDYTALARSATEAELRQSAFGVARELFDGDAPNLIMQAPFLLEVPLPAELCQDAEFVVTATLKGSPDGAGSVQLHVGIERPNAMELMPGRVFVAEAGGATEAELRQAFDDFREFFPATFCYPQIVPVDEVVTLVLHHREDGPLARLMLDDRQQEELDQLWRELRYVTRDPLTTVTVLEQLLEFATQDGDPTVFQPFREPVRQDAAKFEQELLASEPSHVSALLEFAGRAYRRPLEAAEVAVLQGFYDALRTSEMPHDEAVRLTLARILASANFLYRLERPGPASEAIAVSDWELASRLSYFLWSSLPDSELSQAAAAGSLRDAGGLLEQTERMLSDQNIRRMAIEFACQWLHIRDFDQFDEKNERLFPEFAELRQLMYEESVLFLTDLIQNDGSVLDLIDADHTFLNARLAEHYGIPAIEGDHWRRVEGVRRYARGGILGQATILAKHSGASRTSPILRGNWVSETLLGERLPRPPKGVPVLPEMVPDGLTERQLFEQHSSVASCRKCHERIDPYGFALENFDTIGRFRATDGKGHPLDVRSTLMDGTPVEGVTGLRQYLTHARRDTFLRQFCRKLLGYALGRSVQLSDEPLLEEMQSELTQNGYRFSVAVRTIVASPQFQKIRGRAFVGADLQAD